MQQALLTIMSDFSYHHAEALAAYARRDLPRMHQALTSMRECAVNEADRVISIKLTARLRGL